jgi:serine/threonine-protein kinase RsbW
MAKALRLNILSDPATLAGVRHEVEGLCAENGFSQQATGDVGLCVNEALANVMRHAYAGANDRNIDLQADVDERGVTIRIRDWGNGVDPSKLPPKKQSLGDLLKPGGLGLLCLRQMMDRVEFQPQEDGMLLTMEKRK